MYASEIRLRMLLLLLMELQDAVEGTALRIYSEKLDKFQGTIFHHIDCGEKMLAFEERIIRTFAKRVGEELLVLKGISE
jgi:hypothetical protein